MIENEDIGVVEIPIPKKIKGLYADGIIAINKYINTTTEKNCVLAEELGHYHTSSGDIIDQSKIENKKQERRARAWAYKRLVGIIDFINAYKYGVRNRYELSEYLNVSERFLEEALQYYKEKYGLYYKINNYVVYFEPLSVLGVWG